MEKSIFYNYNKLTSFIRGDANIIGSRYKLIDNGFLAVSGWSHFRYFYLQCLALLKNWKKYDIIITHIAGYHSLMPSILSRLKLKKHIIVLHGTDSNIVHCINYGNLSKPILGWATRQSIKWADLLLPVSPSLIQSDSDYNDDKDVSFGLKKNIPDLKTQYQVVYNGVEIKKFPLTEYNRKPNTFLTVASGLNKSVTSKLKGIDLIIELARNNPDYSFTIVGSNSVFGYDNSLTNIRLVGPVNHNDLYNYYQGHKYYLQLSMSESFGLSLCEAMLCGCVPIVSHVGYMPEIVGDYGVVLDKKDDQLLNKIVKKAVDDFHSDTKEQMVNRRQSIIDRFDITLRSQALLQLLEEMK